MVGSGAWGGRQRGKGWQTAGHGMVDSGSGVVDSGAWGGRKRGMGW